MAKKVDAQVLARMRELRDKHGLTKSVIALRLGLSLRTVNYYLNQGAQSAPLPAAPAECTTPA